MDDFEIPISDTSDFEISDSTEFSEPEMIEPTGDMSDEIPIRDDRDSFREPEFSESGSEGNLLEGIEVDSTGEGGSGVFEDDRSEGVQVEGPAYGEPTDITPPEEINDQSSFSQAYVDDQIKYHDELQEHKLNVLDHTEDLERNGISVTNELQVTDEEIKNTNRHLYEETIKKYENK